MRRRQLGLSQATLGGQIGLPQSWISAWERGVSAPTLDSLRRWCAALDMRLTAVEVEANPSPSFNQSTVARFKDPVDNPHFIDGVHV